MALGQLLSGLLPVAGQVAGTIYGGPIGGTVGNALGAAGGNFFGDMFKSQSPAGQARGQLLQQLQGPAPYQRTNFDPLAQEEIRRFNRDVLPNISEQFAGAGGINSSGYRQALSGAGQDLQTRLAALRSQHEMGQDQFMNGAEERRRQMLAGLSGGMYGEEQAQQMGRMNQMNQLAGSIPGQFMDMARFKSGMAQNTILSQILNTLSGQQNQQNTSINQTSQLVNQGLGKFLENLIQQDPTKFEQVLRNYLDLAKAGAEVGGSVARGAVGGV